MLSGGGSQFASTRDDSSEQLSALNTAATRLHASLLEAVSPSYVCKDDYSSEEAEEVTNAIEIDTNNQN